MGELSTLHAISPSDGRYADDLAVLRPFFSEAALMRYRVRIELQYFIALTKTVAKLSKAEARFLQDITVTDRQLEQIKTIEQATRHDVKAIEYYLKNQLAKTSLKNRLELIHFGLTSEDINNLAYSLMLRDSLKQVYLPALKNLIYQLKKAARHNASLALLSLTHGQAATPTTLGKELNVFVLRLQRQYDQLRQIKQFGKFSGATGNWAALHVAYPKINWLKFSKKFVQSLGLEFNPVTTQIESHDRLVETYHIISLINSIIKDLDQDMWLYMARGLFVQQHITGEIGSSTMPHKINPIFFENSEGNAGVANALLNHLAEKLPISRLQRDLTDSTVLRNQGVAVAHSLLAVRNTIKALTRVEPNKPAIQHELNQHWEVLAEPIQTVMRQLGKTTPYEQLKRLTKGQQLDKMTLHMFIDQLDIPTVTKQNLKKLTPANYSGLSKQLAKL